MNIVALDASRRERRFVYELTKGCSEKEAGDHRSYLFDAIGKTDPLEQKGGVRMDRHPGANLAQCAGLFKDCHVQSAPPQGERGRQAADPAADDGDLKLLRHHILPSQAPISGLADFIKLLYALRFNVFWGASALEQFPVKWAHCKTTL